MARLPRWSRERAHRGGTGLSAARQRWRHAVELGGRGRYARAATLLQALLDDPVTPAGVAAHTAVTLASHRRQQGGHAAARALDGRGLVLARAAGPEEPDEYGTDAGAAHVDALVGLAADAAGSGDPDGAVRLLDAAAAQRHPSWRPAVRAGWVRAEVALFAGRASAAVVPAETALTAARAAGSERHILKSRLVRAVVAAVLHPDGVVLAELDAVAAAAAQEFRPLEWPARLAGADLVDRLEARRVIEKSSSANDRGSRARTASPDGRPPTAARRRHAAAVSVNALYQLADPQGRRLMRDSLFVSERLPLV